MFALTVPYFFAVITEMSPVASRACRLTGDYAATSHNADHLHFSSAISWHLVVSLLDFLGTARTRHRI